MTFPDHILPFVFRDEMKEFKTINGRLCILEVFVSGALFWPLVPLGGSERLYPVDYDESFT